MIRFYILLGFYIVSGSLFCQKTLVDSLFKNPIQHVEIYTDKGEIIGYTDEQGNIKETSYQRMKENGVHSLFFYKVGYEEKKISVSNMMSKDTIYMTKINTPIDLEEVVLVGNRTIPKYIKIITYFRSIQFNNSQPQFFMDGIAEYYINVQNNKVKAKLVQNRSYRDKSIKKIDEKGLIRLNFNIVGFPNVDAYINEEELKKEYEVSEVEDGFKLIVNEKLIGKYDKKQNILEMQIYSEENPKIMKGFGSKSILNDYYINAYYNNDSIVSLNSFKETRSYKIKPKKDKGYTRIDTTHELYVISKQGVNERKKAKSNSYYEFSFESNYIDNYWKAINDKNIPPLPVTVEKFLDNNFYKL